MVRGPAAMRENLGETLGEGHEGTEGNGASAFPLHLASEPGQGPPHVSLRSFLKCSATPARRGLAWKPLPLPGSVCLAPNAQPTPELTQLSPPWGPFHTGYVPSCLVVHLPLAAESGSSRQPKHTAQGLTQSRCLVNAYLA